MLSASHLSDQHCNHVLPPILQMFSCIRRSCPDQALTTSVVPCDNHQLTALTRSCSCLTRSPPCQVLGPLLDIIQADRKWQERPDHHGHQHPGSPGSKRIKSNAESVRDAALALDDMQLRHTLYNTGASALVHFELKDQGMACALMQYNWTSCLCFFACAAARPKWEC